MTRELTVIATCDIFLSVDPRHPRLYNATGKIQKAYLDVQRGTCPQKFGSGEVRRASHVVTTILPEKNAFNLTALTADPHVTALLLIEVVDHDLMLDIFNM